jgi:hypothetical protein
MEQTKKITKMKQETKATIAYLAAIIFVIICIALMAVTPAYGQNQTVIKDSKGEVVYVKIKTASGYIVKDKNGVLLYTVVENDTEKRVYDASGRLISVEKKAKKMKTMKDQVTSIEQSKRLIDLGVPAEKASMVWATCSGKYHLSVLPHYKATPEYIKSGESIPAFTVADLLGVMPPDIPAVVGQNHDYALTLSNNFCWNLRYENSHTHQCIGEQLEFDLVDLLCNRIEWIVSNGYGLNL